MTPISTPPLRMCCSYSSTRLFGDSPVRQRTDHTTARVPPRPPLPEPPPQGRRRSSPAIAAQHQLLLPLGQWFRPYLPQARRAPWHRNIRLLRFPLGGLPGLVRQFGSHVDSTEALPSSLLGHQQIDFGLFVATGNRGFVRTLGSLSIVKQARHHRCAADTDFLVHLESPTVRRCPIKNVSRPAFVPVDSAVISGSMAAIAIAKSWLDDDASVPSRRFES